MFAHPYNLSQIQKEIIQRYSIKNKVNFDKDFVSENIIKLASKSLDGCVATVSDEFGCGVCISEKGYILTVAHSAYYDIDQREETEILMMFPSGIEVVTKIADRDEDLDIALVKVIKVKNSNKITKFPFCQIYSGEADVIDQKVFCIGNPCHLDMENGSDTRNE